MANNYWYSVMLDDKDIDYGYGFKNLDFAKRLINILFDEYPDCYIAVIDFDSGLNLVDIIRPDRS